MAEDDYRPSFRHSFHASDFEGMTRAVERIKRKRDRAACWVLLGGSVATLLAAGSLLLVLTG